MKKLLLTILFLGASQQTIAETLKMPLDYGPIIKQGTTLECHTLSPRALELYSNETYKWAIKEGWIQSSKITNTVSYTDQVPHLNNADKKELVVGCWVTQEVIKETVNGKEKAYAVATYQVNEAVMATPLKDIKICKYTKKSSVTYNSRDYVLLPYTKQQCAPVNRETVEGLAKLTKEQSIFPLEKAKNNKGYQRESSISF